MPSKTIMGISNLDVRSHDNTACILKDGKLLAQAEEERFTRRRYAYDSLPIQSIRYCLDATGTAPADVDTIAVGWDLPHAVFDKNRTPVVTSDTRTIIGKLLGPGAEPERTDLRFVKHHHAHAEVAYHTSGFHDAAILVVDGAGESDATTLWTAGDSLRIIDAKGQYPDSLGFMYEGVSEYLGFKGNEAGKVMGLAAHCSDSVEPFDIVTFQNGYSVRFPRTIHEAVLREFVEKDNYYVMDEIAAHWIRYCETLFGPRVPYEPHLGEDHPDFRRRARVAAILQKTLEEAVLSCVKLLKRETGSDNLCMGGGVALNCSANGRVDRSGVFPHTFIYPATNDAGVALGAALHILREERADVPRVTIDHAFWGPEFSDDKIAKLLRESSISFTECREDFSDIAEMISRGAIVGWFQGRMEIGPRALGARSILADPRSIGTRDRVNILKGREHWRPLAPSILEGYEAEFFEDGAPSPFMLKAHKVRPEKRALIPAVTHVDHSSRHQSVSQRTNPRFWKLIESFRRLTGIPMLLNTSFNRKEPIVCTPQDALRTFPQCKLDHLVLGKFRIQQHPSPLAV